MQENFNSHIVCQNKNGIEYIQFKKLLEYPEVAHCYTLRSGDKLSTNLQRRKNTKTKLSENLRMLGFRC